MDQERHIARVAVAPELLLGQIITGQVTHFECMDGVPKGARLVGMYTDQDYRVIWLMLEHPSFDAVHLGERPPELSVTLHTLGQGGEEILDTILHETLHGVISALKLEGDKVDDEQTVSLLAMALADILTRNGWLREEG